MLSRPVTLNKLLLDSNVIENGCSGEVYDQREEHDVAGTVHERVRNANSYFHDLIG